MPETTLITGASSGIGMELAKVFARNGHNLLITARRSDRLARLKKELEEEFHVQAAVCPLDLADAGAPKKLFEFAENHSLTIDILVNNAGVGDYGFFHQSEWDRQCAMIDLNIKSLTHLTHLFLPGLVRQKKAYIMNVASTAAFQPGPLMSVYYAGKHYVLAFSEAIANELADTNVSVTALCPGPTRSEFQEKANMEKTKLFEWFPVASSRQVAEYGYSAMKKGKRVAIYGMLNKMTPKLVSLFPRKMVTSVVRFIQQKK